MGKRERKNMCKKKGGFKMCCKCLFFVDGKMLYDSHGSFATAREGSKKSPFLVIFNNGAKRPPKGEYGHKKSIIICVKKKGVFKCVLIVCFY